RRWIRASWSSSTARPTSRRALWTVPTSATRVPWTSSSRLSSGCSPTSCKLASTATRRSRSASVRIREDNDVGVPLLAVVAGARDKDESAVVIVRVEQVVRVLRDLLLRPDEDVLNQVTSRPVL